MPLKACFPTTYRCLLPVLTGFFLTTAANSLQGAFSAVLQGQSRGSTQWIGGNLQNWRELDFIPCRVYLDGGPATSQFITIQFDHFSNRNPGIEDLSAFTTSSNVRFDVAPVLNAPSDQSTWSYTFTVSLTDNQPGFVEFRARLMAGAHLNTGSSLSMKWKSGLGVLQIHKPAPGSGAPDLMLVKSGPTNTYAGSVITYNVVYSNRLGTATGIQVNDILPDALTYVTNSATGNGRLIGNNLIWEIGTMAPQATGTLSYQVLVNPGLTNGYTFTNYARIFSAEDDANYSDNTSSVKTGVVAAPPPAAANDAYIIDEDTTLSVSNPGVLLNDTDATQRPLNALLVTATTHGTLVLSNAGGFLYQPAPGFNGTDQFTYKANNGSATSGVATVTITVRPVNDGPTATDDTYTVNEDTALQITAPGVLSNDSDPDGDVLSAVLVGGPAHGSVTLDPAGSFIYRPNTNFNGVDSFIYRANDGILNSGTATVRITVVPVNDAPLAVDDSYTINEDTTLRITAPGVLGNDSDPDSDVLRAVLATGPAHGSVTLDVAGSFVYVPNTNFSGVDSFTYRASDGALNSGVATVRITVLPANDAPAAIDDAYSVNEDTTLRITAPGILANDSDPDGDALKAVLATGPAHGSVTLDVTGGFVYVPNTNFNGSDLFTYRANDGVLDSAIATVRITVVPVNDAPVAVDDAYSVNEDTTLRITAPGVLGNDSDPEGDALRAALVTAPSHGSVTLDPAGSFVYVPNTNFSGMDLFTYKANDGAMDSAIATVRITVVPVDDAPVAIDDAYSVNEDSTLRITAPGVLGNDSDPDGDALRAVLAGGPAHGSVTVDPNGSFVYIPNTNFSGADSFTYQANDGAADSAIATVRITVVPVNDSPVAIEDAYSVNEDTTLRITAPGVLGNDSDPDGDVLRAVLIAGPAHGSVIVDPSGSFVYIPNTNFTGVDSFTYRANDGVADSAIATVRITVVPVNDAPVAVDDAYSVNEDTTLRITTPGVLSNDSDPDGDALRALLVVGPSQGSVTLDGSGSVVYIPNTNFSGADLFTYRANDGLADSAIATVRITVVPVNDAPVAVDDAYTVNEDTTLRVTAPGVLGNDNDPDGDMLRAVLVTGPAHGSVTVDPNGSFVYIPNTNFSGADSFTYRANDGLLDSSIATVRITVLPVNDAPAAVDDAYSVNEDATLRITVPGVLGNDSDPDGDALRAVLATSPTHGSVTLDSNGSFVYIPNTNFNGADLFTYRVNDGALDSGIATVRITVLPVNDAPMAADDSYTVNEDTTLTITAPGVLSNDSDPDGDVLRAVRVIGPTHGTVTLDSTGSFVYVPNTNFNGVDSFMYRANDGVLDSAMATVRITVLPANDAPLANDDAYDVNENGSLTISAPGVLANDSDPDGDILQALLATPPAHGDLRLDATGQFVYVPNTNFSGADSFTYRANDGTLDSRVATVRITVIPVNHPPVANDDAYSISEDTTLTISAPGVLANDTDPDGDTIKAVLVAPPIHGNLTLDLAGSFVYLPNTNFNGIDSFTYRANDGTRDSSIATVRITVLPSNDAPVTTDDSYSINEDNTLIIMAPGVLSNDVEMDNDPLTAASFEGPSHGTLTLEASGAFTYKPAADFNGSDSFTYRASDGQTSSVAIVTIAVNPVNDPPSFIGGSNQLVNENSGPKSVAHWATGMSAGPADESNQKLTFSLSTQPTALFSVLPSISANGTLSFAPAVDAFGTANVTVVLKDDGGTANGGNDTSAERTFAIVINAPPVVTMASPTNGSFFQVTEDITVVADAYDPDGSVAKVEIFQGTNTVAVLTNAPYYLVLTNAVAGDYEFNARATDNLGSTGTATPIHFTVLDRPPILRLGPIRLNRQTGLFEETVRVINPTRRPYNGVRVLVKDLSPSVSVYNASGQTNGVPYLQSAMAVAPGGFVDLTIEYYVRTSQLPSSTLSAEVIAPIPPPSPTGTGERITRELMLSNGTYLMEFNSLSNRIYYMQYSTNLIDWKTVVPAIPGTGTRVQWIDNGPPKTESIPALNDHRFYRLILLP